MLSCHEGESILLDTRLYDAASRVVQSGPNGSLHPDYVAALYAGGTGNGSETRLNRYDANGQLLAQRVLKSDNTNKYDIYYKSRDNAGNVLEYDLVNHDGGNYTSTFSTSLVRFEGYKEGVVSGTSTQYQPGSTTNTYDV